VNWPGETLDAAMAGGVRHLTLHGVRRLRAIGASSSEIEELGLVYGRHPIDLSGLESLRSLRSLTLKHLKLQNPEAIGEVASLERLTLVSCGDIQDLGFTAGLTALRHVAMHGVTVLSRDLSPLDHVSGSRYVQAKPGYNRRFTEAATVD
jgi:hypothetical protein